MMRFRRSTGGGHRSVIKLSVGALVWLVSVLLSTMQARETTLPPSIALRTEVSFVNVAMLQSSEPEDNQRASLSFKLVKNLHNTAEPEFQVSVTSSLASRLEIGREYVIAYQRVKKVRDNEAKVYVRLPEGAELMQVQGAYPAIFKRNDLLIDRLTSSPELAQSHPQQLIQEIFSGIEQTDPAIKSFFVREIVNWNALYEYLNESHYQSLFDAMISPNANASVKTAVLELREPLHSGIGVERIGQQALHILKYMSVDLDPLSEEPALVLNALWFVERYQMTDWDTVSRWTRSSVPTIAERAMLILNTLDASRIRQLAQQRLDETYHSAPVRRVMARFVD